MLHVLLLLILIAYSALVQMSVLDAVLDLLALYVIPVKQAMLILIVEHVLLLIIEIIWSVLPAQ